VQPRAAPPPLPTARRHTLVQTRELAASSFRQPRYWEVDRRVAFDQYALTMSDARALWCMPSKSNQRKMPALPGYATQPAGRLPMCGSGFGGAPEVMRMPSSARSSRPRPPHRVAPLSAR